VLGIHSSAIGQTRVNGDFERKEINGVKDGAHHHLSPNMHQSLMKFALKIAPNVRRSEKHHSTNNEKKRKRSRICCKIKRCWLFRKNMQTH
jgi:hypothetical protein